MPLFKERSGYSLVELLIALTILGIGLMATLRLFTQSLDNVQTANQRAVVSQLAESYMGRARAAGAKDLLVYRPRSVTVDAEADNSEDLAFFNNWSMHTEHVSAQEEVFLQRLTLVFELPDGRRETFVTYVARQ